MVQPTFLTHQPFADAHCLGCFSHGITNTWNPHLLPPLARSSEPSPLRRSDTSVEEGHPELSPTARRQGCPDNRQPYHCSGSCWPGMGAQPSWVWWRPPEAGSPKILVQDTAIGGWPVCGVVMPYAEGDSYSPGRLAGFRPRKAGSVADPFLLEG